MNRISLAHAVLPSGRHRIEGTFDGGSLKFVGADVPFEHPALYKTVRGTHIVFTEYWNNSLIVPSRIYLLTEVEG
jgi:hypothetical protein